MSNLESCPICNSESELIRSISKDYIEKRLESLVEEKIPENLGIIDYKLLRCKKCSFEYASPLTPGNNSFYQWITNQTFYYPESRWEWFAILDYIKQQSSDTINVLEIGCGSGIFLEMLTQLPNLEILGLDTTKTSVEHCRAKGLRVYCETIDSFLENPKYENKKFDFIVSFHCLEHVKNPKGFVASMLSLLNANGSLFLSTPYSPISYETVKSECLNEPPHHLTRWNHSSYQELAKQLCLKIDFLMPKADWAIKRVFQAFYFASKNPKKLWESPAKKIIRIFPFLLSPGLVYKEWKTQKKRDKINNQVAADVVLVKLTRY
jgi:2-polyprenyl-3-methyl-5-hydroxy-6-metoxy-1,4-benzoquinol methylase